MQKENEKELYLKLRKEFDTYVCDSFFGNIISSYENIEPWIYEFYISLQLEKAAPNPVFVTDTILKFTGGWTAPERKFEYQVYEKEYFKEHDILDLVRENINQNEYIYTFLDESIFHDVPFSVHDNIVLGYDEFNKEVIVCGFYDFKIQKIRIAYDKFREAFHKAVENDYKQKLGLEKFYRSYKLVVPVDQPYKLNIDNVKCYLEDYLNSKVGNSLLYEGEELKEEHNLENSLFGEAIFAALKEEVIHCLEVKTGGIDIRKFSLVYNYVLLMKERIAYFRNVLSYDFSQLSSRVEQAIFSAQTLCNVVLKYNLKRTENPKWVGVILENIDVVQGELHFITETLLKSL